VLRKKKKKKIKKLSMLGILFVAFIYSVSSIVENNGSCTATSKNSPVPSNNFFDRKFVEDWKIFDPLSNEISFPFRSFFNALRPQNDMMKPLTPLMSADFTETENEFIIHGKINNFKILKN
jgi:hypothetical protein